MLSRRFCLKGCIAFPICMIYSFSIIWLVNKTRKALYINTVPLTVHITLTLQYLVLTFQCATNVITTVHDNLRATFDEWQACKAKSICFGARRTVQQPNKIHLSWNEDYSMGHHWSEWVQYYISYIHLHHHLHCTFRALWLSNLNSVSLIGCLGSHRQNCMNDARWKLVFCLRTVLESLWWTFEQNHWIWVFSPLRERRLKLMLPESSWKKTAAI